MATVATPSKASSELAIDKGPKTFAKRTGKPRNKIGVEEFMSIAERFGFSEAAMEKLRAAVTDDDLIPGGPNLAKYACGSPQPTKGSAFESLAREKFGTKYALGVSSGTGALHAAMVAVGVKPGAEVIVPAMGFVATAGAAALAGGVPVFCDVDESMQIDPRKIEPLITGRTVAIAPTHHWGNVCDMDPIMKIARKHKLKVVEDCAQSPGARYKGRYVGSIGDIGCFSISCYKIIGGGEGGLVLANDERLFERANQLAEAGGLWRGEKRFAPPRYEGELFPGTNYRMSELEAAVDLVQLQKLDGIVRAHHEVNTRICRQLVGYREIVPQKINDAEGHVGYFLRFYAETTELARKIAVALQAEGIPSTAWRGSGPDWHLYSDMFPVHLPGHATHQRGACPVADDLYRRNVTVMLDAWYSPEDCDAIAGGINKVLSAYCTEDDASAPWL